jgi:hypothetical protein
MIKVNYDEKTGKVTAFGKDLAPYIEITEEERRQPLPDKYSHYAVVNGKFTVVSREPTAEEKAKDAAQAKAKRLAEIDNWFKTNDWKFNKVYLGEWEITDPRWVEYLNKRAAMRKEYDELISKGV